MLRIAGIRINPKTNGLHNVTFETSLLLRKIPEGTEVKVDLPPNPLLSGARWSPDGKQFAFTNTTAAGIELWVGDTTGKTHKMEGVRVNAVMGGGAGGGGGRGGFSGGGGGNVQWMPDGKSLLVFTVRADRGPAPAVPLVPPGPHVQESLGGGAPAPTLEDMLADPHDEDLFVYYATSQLANVDLATGKATPIGKPGILESVHVSPNGKDLLVTTIHKPFSYLHSYNSFPKEVEVWDRTGKMVHKVASTPLEDKAPLNGVTTGPRNSQWRVSEPATLLWVEALDGGDLKNQAPLSRQGDGSEGALHRRAHRAREDGSPLHQSQMAAKGGLAFVGGLRPQDAPRPHLPDRSGQARSGACLDLEPQPAGSLQGSGHARDEGDRQRASRHCAGWRQHLLGRRGLFADRRPSVPRSLQPRHQADRAPVPLR